MRATQACTIFFIAAALSAVLGAASVDGPGPCAPCVAAQALVQRAFPAAIAARFAFEPLEAQGASTGYLPATDAFEIAADGAVAVVTVRGTSAVAMAAGAYRYFKDALNGTVTWGEDGSGTRVDDLPPNAPLPPMAVRRTALAPVRYGWNMCTFSYSAVWWGADRWLREVDWMALHGINMPLAVTGVEYVWAEVYRKHFGVQFSDLQEWFAGPAFLTWQRMGNLRGFGGPLPLSWLVQQRDLQRVILARMRSLRMVPVLSCFAGHVPAVARALFPDARFRRSQRWGGFGDEHTGVWSIDPTAAEYRKVGEAFMTEQRALYGGDGFYNCDTFNEADPSSTDEAALAAASRAVSATIRAVDPAGVWIMQGWLFYFSPFWTAPRVRAYLSGVASSEVIILDLVSEQRVVALDHGEYYGKPWVWNLLHNFGGVRGMYGDTRALSRLPTLVQRWKHCVGVGFTAEAIEHNSVVFELLTDTFFPPVPGTPLALPLWTRSYAAQRYGLAGGEHGAALWQLLFHTLYSDSAMQLYARSPADNVPKLRPSVYGVGPKSTAGVLRGLRLALAIEAATDGGGGPQPIHTDLIDLALVAGTVFFDGVVEVLRAVTMPTTPLLPNLDAANATVAAYFTAVDAVLCTNPNFLLGRWLDSARRAAPAGNWTALFEFNARNQVTLWSPTSGNVLDGYARKAWCGLYRDYYGVRWGIFLHGLMQAVAAKAPLDEHWTYARIHAFSERWSSEQDPSMIRYPNTTSGEDTATAVRRLLRDVLLLSPSAFQQYFAPAAVDAARPAGTFAIRISTRSTQVIGALCLRLLGERCTGVVPRLGILLVTSNAPESPLVDIPPGTAFFIRSGV